MKKIIFFLGLIISTSAFSQTKSTDLIGEDSSKVNWDLLNDIIIKEINSEREKLGLPSLIMCGEAMHFAKMHTLNMKEKGVSHSSDRTRYSECCLEGFIGAKITYIDGAKALVSIWKNSEPHWKILMGKYNKCGISVMNYEKSKFVLGYPVRSTLVVE